MIKKESSGIGCEQHEKQQMAKYPEHLLPYRFQPGVSGNKNGRPKKEFDREDVSIVYQKYARLTKEQLEEIIKNPKSVAIEVTTARGWLNSMANGDGEAALNRAVGKVTEEVKMSIPSPSVIERISGEISVVGIIDGDPRQYLVESSDDKDQSNQEHEE